MFLLYLFAYKWEHHALCLVLKIHEEYIAFMEGFLTDIKEYFESEQRAVK